MIAESQLDLLSYFEAIPFDDTVPAISIDVPLKGGRNTARLTLAVKYLPTIIKYCFEIHPEKECIRRSRPSMILSCPQLMLSPSDLAKPSLPCDFSTHPVLDWKGNQVFSCRVIHSLYAWLSAVEIIDKNGQVVATSHTISPSMFPERSAVKDQRNNILLNQKEGERAMLIRGRNDWAVCIGKLLKMNPASKRRQKWQHFLVKEKSSSSTC